jgi:hypothetical protein
MSHKPYGRPRPVTGIYLPFITYIQDAHKRSLNFRKFIAKRTSKTMHPNFQDSYDNCENF